MRKPTLILIGLYLMAVSALAGQSVVPMQASGEYYGFAFIEGYADSIPDDSILIANDYLASGDSLVGAVIALRTAGFREARYIVYVSDTLATGQCSVMVSSDWSTTSVIDTVLFTIFPSVPPNNRTVVPWVQTAPESYSGWDITKNDTVYSVPMLWSEASWGDGYKFTYECYAESTQLERTNQHADSMDIKVWVETSHDARNWAVPTGYSSVIANLTTYGKTIISNYSLPVGTKYFRIGVVGNTANSAETGQVFLSQWLLMKGK